MTDHTAFCSRNQKVTQNQEGFRKRDEQVWLGQVWPSMPRN